jgi:hypothetical protein
MSKVGSLTDLIAGSHVMGENGLRDYHVAAAAIKALRLRAFSERLNAIRVALKNHRVQVSYDDQGVIRVFRPDRGAELFFPPSPSQL